MGRPEVLNLNERSMIKVLMNLRAYPKEPGGSDPVYLSGRNHSQAENSLLYDRFGTAVISKLSLETEREDSYSVSEKTHLLTSAETSFSEILIRLIDEVKIIYSPVKEIILSHGDKFRASLNFILIKLRQGSKTTFDPVYSILITQYLLAWR